MPEQVLIYRNDGKRAWRLRAFLAAFVVALVASAIVLRHQLRSFWARWQAERQWQRCLSFSRPANEPIASFPECFRATFPENHGVTEDKLIYLHKMAAPDGTQHLVAIWGYASSRDVTWMEDHELRHRTAWSIYCNVYAWPVAQPVMQPGSIRVLSRAGDGPAEFGSAQRVTIFNAKEVEGSGGAPRGIRLRRRWQTRHDGNLIRRGRLQRIDSCLSDERSGDGLFEPVSCPRTLS